MTMLVYQLVESLCVWNPYGVRQYAPVGQVFQPVIAGGGQGVGPHCRITFAEENKRPGIL